MKNEGGSIEEKHIFALLLSKMSGFQYKTKWSAMRCWVYTWRVILLLAILRWLSRLVIDAAKKEENAQDYVTLLKFLKDKGMDIRCAHNTEEEKRVIRALNGNDIT